MLVRRKLVRTGSIWQQFAGRWSRLLLLAAVTGLAAGFFAAAVEWGIHAGTEQLIGRVLVPGYSTFVKFGWGILLFPALGGLLTGLSVLRLCPNSESHGTSALTRAYHRGHGVMPLRPALVKGVGTAVVISCGGSAGPEGPIAALGAALGSTVGHAFRVTPRERRILLLAGCAAGIGAIFRCPLGGALFAVSILYREPDYETEAIVPSVVASVIGYSTFMSLWGYGKPLLHDADKLVFTSPLELAPYAVLALLCGVVSIFFSGCFSVVKNRLTRWTRLPRWLAPLLGGLLTGALACLIPAVMDSRYQIIQSIMDGQIVTAHPTVSWWEWAGFFTLIALAKCLATACTVGSGAPGGILGPSLFIGGAAGAVVGALCEGLFPGLFPEPLRRALIPVGMGGVLSASMRVPMAAIVMAMEMTGGYGLIVPSMLVCVGAYIVGRPWGLNREQVPTSAESPVHAADAIVHLLEFWRVHRFLETPYPYVVTPGTSLGEIVRQIEPGTQPTFAVVEDGQLQGIISLPDLHRVMRKTDLTQVVIAHDIMTVDVTPVTPVDDLQYALTLFRLANQNVLPVVDQLETRRWLGMISRRRIYEAVSEQIEANKRFVFEEYEGLVAIEQEAQLDILLSAVTPRTNAHIERLMVPLAALGKSIRACDFRKQFGCFIVAIELPDGTLQFPPDLDLPLESAHRLLTIVDEATT